MPIPPVKQPQATVISPAWGGVVGSLLMAAAALVPSTVWLSILRGSASSYGQPLLTGATLFRLSLFVLGIAWIVLSRVSWKTAPASRPLRSEGRMPAVILALILLVAFGLRLYKLGSGLWLDEIYTLTTYARIPFGQILTTYASENQHFLYSLMAHACFRIFGESAWALRLPAVLFGVGSIWALYLLARRAAGTREALLASGLLTLSYHHIWFSQNARGYTGLLFWALLSSWLFLCAFRDGRPRLWLWYAAAVALGIYTHTTMVFVVAGHFLVYILELLRARNEAKPDRWAGAFAGFGMAGLFTFQLHSIVLPQIFSGMEKTVSVVDAWKKPLWTLMEMMQGLQVNFAGGIAALTALAIFGAGLWSYLKKEPAIVGFLLIPPIAGACLVMWVGHHLWPRFFFFAFGFAVLIVIRGALTAGGFVARALRMPSRAQALGTVACLGLTALSAASLTHVYGPKQDYAGALAFVNSNRATQDAVVMVGLAAFPLKSLYGADWQEVKSLDSLNAVRKHAERTWLVYTLQPVLQSVYPDIMQTVQRDFKVVGKFGGTLREGTIYVCRSDEHPGDLATVWQR